VNTHLLLRGISGSSRALRQVLAALRADEALSVQELAGPPRRGTRARRLASWIWWDLYGVHKAIREPSVLLSGCNVGRASSRHPNVLLMHDTMVLDHPREFDPAYVAYARALFPLSARSSTLVVTSSEHSSRRIVDRFGCPRPPEVIPWPCTGAPELPSKAEMAARLAWPVVTVVGATEPHKCQRIAVLAVRLMRQATGLPIELYMIGKPGREDAAIDHLVEALDRDGCWIRRGHSLTDAALSEQYRASWLVLQTSLDEGFGLPVLEACGHGVPVLHSGRGALPEVHPEGSVGSLAPEAFAERALQLLDADAYQRACTTAVDSARRHSWDSFAASWQRVVRDAWSFG
jgi:Glycosyl transferases group 1